MDRETERSTTNEENKREGEENGGFIDGDGGEEKRKVHVLSVHSQLYPVVDVSNQSAVQPTWKHVVPVQETQQTFHFKT